jgi:hypothetical protein
VRILHEGRGIGGILGIVGIPLRLNFKGAVGLRVLGWVVVIHVVEVTKLI